MGNENPLHSNTPLLEDAEQIIQAIRTGCVDAFVVEESEGHAVYALESADLPYSTLVQRMQQGAAMLNRDGEMIYCNPSLSSLLEVPVTELVGRSLLDLVSPEDRPACAKLLASLQLGPCEAEVQLRRGSGSVPAKLSLVVLAIDRSVIGLLVNDLTTEKSNAELASHIQHIQDEERRNIARELHDSVGQNLAAIAMNLSRLRAAVPRDADGQLDLLNDSTAMVEQVVKEIRTISYLLHPPLLDLAGLASAIRWYVDGFSERSRIQVHLQIPADLGRLPQDFEIAIYRIVQESLTNVYRHSGGDACHVSMQRKADHIRVEVRDNGHGLPSNGKALAKSSGLGIRGMQERLRQLGGSLEILSSEAGTTVVATLPMQRVNVDDSPVSQAG